MKNLSVRKIILTLVLAVLNVVSNLIANLTVEGGWRIIWLVLGIGALAAIAYILIRNILNPPHVSVQFDQAVPIRQEEYQRHARKGLILLLSDFKPNPGSPAHHLTEKERLELAEKGDYDSLHLGSEGQGGVKLDGDGEDGIHRLGSQFGGAGKLVFCEGVGEVEDEHGGYFSK